MLQNGVFQSFPRFAAIAGLYHDVIHTVIQSYSATKVLSE